MLQNREFSDPKIPSWLNDSFFTDIVENEFGLHNGEYTVRISSVSNLADKCANYSSDLYSASIQIQENNNDEFIQMHFIIKAVPDTTKKLSHLSKYYKELELYSRILPGFEKEWQLIGERMQFSPKFYQKHIDGLQIITIEDLRAKNFVVCDRFKGLDLHHARIFYEKLAKFHATSMVYYQKFGPYSDQFQENLFRDETKVVFETCMNSTLSTFVEVIENHPPISKYANKIKSWIGKHLLELKMVTNPKYSSFNVLSHGDCWTSNLLFSYDDNGKPNNVIFIDYQNPMYSPPAIDIFYFFVSSLANEYRDGAFDHLMEVYHNNLVSTLKKLHYPKHIITLRELHMDLIKRGLIAPMCTLAILSIAKYHDHGENPVDSIFLIDEQSINLKKKVLSNPAFLTALEHTFPFLDRRGFLDLSADYLTPNFSN